MEIFEEFGDKKITDRLPDLGVIDDDWVEEKDDKVLCDRETVDAGEFLGDKGGNHLEGFRIHQDLSGDSKRCYEILGGFMIS